VECRAIAASGSANWERWVIEALSNECQTRLDSRRDGFQKIGCLAQKKEARCEPVLELGSVEKQGFQNRLM
jgi:hypothetical protein